jgi:hypothetical protein
VVSTCTTRESSEASFYSNATQVRHTRLSSLATGTKSCINDKSKMAYFRPYGLRYPQKEAKLSMTGARYITITNHNPRWELKQTLTAILTLAHEKQ